MSSEPRSGLSNEQIDERLSPLKAGLKRLQEGAREFDEVIRLYDEKIVIIEREREAAEKLAEEAKARAITAEQAEKEANEKYKQALALKEGKFDELVEELFASPSRQLRESIESAAQQSSALTQRTTLYSIILTVIVAVISLILGNLQGSAINRRLEQTAGTIEGMSKDGPTLQKKIDSFGSQLAGLNAQFADLSSSTREASRKRDRNTFAVLGFTADINSETCVQRGESVLKEAGAEEVTRLPTATYGYKGLSLLLIYCIETYKVVTIEATGPIEDNPLRLQEEVVALWAKRGSH